MKKNVKMVVIIVLVIIGVLAFVLTHKKESNEPMPMGPGPQGPAQIMGESNNRTVYGIPNSEFEALGLSKDQHDKIVALQKAYDEKYMFTQGKEKSAAEKKKLEAESREAYKQLLKEIKAIFTPDQLKAYEKAYNTQVAKTKEILTKESAIISKKANLSKEQNDKVANLIKNFDGDQLTFNENFMNILSADQKKAYENYLREKREVMMRGNSDTGNYGADGYKPDRKPDYKPNFTPGDENGQIMPPPTGQPGMGDGNGLPPDYKPDGAPGPNGQMMPPPPGGAPGGPKPDFKPDFKPDQAPN